MAFTNKTIKKMQRNFIFPALLFTDTQPSILH